MLIKVTHPVRYSYKKQVVVISAGNTHEVPDEIGEQFIAENKAIQIQDKESAMSVPPPAAEVKTRRRRSKT